eukprot:TRINITY_DN2118_c0_g2_i2.p1 TRINITY_DN2118_c0_g2~~TRINITY_DN2118_c0_g2_i2.p1  ORF type:complete len:489 (+),score=67.16 TRINITY_DN2118_c0_g2_i2:132-1598(+)
MDAGPQLHAAEACEAQVVRVMRKFPDVASIQCWGARAINKLTADESYDSSSIQRSFEQAGACAALVAALVTHRPDATVQVACLRAVCILLADECTANCCSFQDAGISTALVAAMRRHAAHAGIQVAACMAMARLASADGSSGVDCAFQLARAGATDALIAAVRAHIQHATVPCQALHALCVVVVPHHGQADVTLPQTLAAQVAQAVVAAMRADVTRQDLQAAAATALEEIVRRSNGGGAAIAQQFLVAGAGEALMEALAASTRDGAAAHVLFAIIELAYHGDSAAELLAAGTAEAIMAAIAKHCYPLSADYKCSEVLATALAAIAVLASRAPAASARLSAVGACDAVVSTVLLHIQAPNNMLHQYRLHSGLEALAALASAAESHSPAVALSLVQAGACEAATAAVNILLTACDSSNNMSRWVMRTICGLSADAGAAARLRAAGAREAVASAIPRCSDCPYAVQSAQLALDRLAADAANVSSEPGSQRR